MFNKETANLVDGLWYYKVDGCTTSRMDELPENALHRPSTSCCQSILLNYTPTIREPFIMCSNKDTENACITEIRIAMLKLETECKIMML